MKYFSILAAFVFCLTFGVISDFSTAAAASQPGSETVINKVSINTADEAGLVQVPGIGPKTAAAIVEYRKSIGSFTSIEQLLEVKGIGEKKLAKMKPYLTL